MATIDYSRRLENLRQRKFDQSLNESRLSKSFPSKEIPVNIKYLLESMRSLEQAYNAKTQVAGNRVQSHLESGFNLHFNRAYYMQGSMSTDTNIRIYSDIDLLTVIDRYHYIPEGQFNYYPYEDSDPFEDILSLRNQAIRILRNHYDEVDSSGAKSISVKNKSLNRKVDVVFAFWFHPIGYQESKNQFHRGIYLFDFNKGIRIENPDFPFAHIAHVNRKGDETDDGSRQGIRLLKNLKVDYNSDPGHEELIELSSFQLTSIVHVIENSLLRCYDQNELSIAKSISAELDRMISNRDYCSSIKSPNGTEYPLQDFSLVSEMLRLKKDLDLLIEDCEKELKSEALRKAIVGY